MKKHLKIGLCGFGFMGKTHLYAVRNLPFFCDLPFTAEVSALCTAHPERTATLAAEWGIPKAVPDEESLMKDPDIAVIDVCTPNPCHFETVRRALLCGKHVLCEKPLTVTAAEAESLCTLAKSTGLTVGTVFNNRFLAPVMRAKQLIEEGRLGRVLSFDFAYRHDSCIDPQRRAGWKQMADFGGGTLADLGPHVIDLCLFLCGPLASVIGRSQIAFPAHSRPDGSLWQTDADEAFYMLCRTKDGARGTVTVSKLTQGAEDGLTFSVWGDQGALSFDLMEPNTLRFYDAAAPVSPVGGLRGYTAIDCTGRYPAPAAGFPSVKAPAGWLRGHVMSMANFLSAVAEGRPCVPSFEEGAYVQWVMEAARQSDATGSEVSLC